MWAEPRSRKPNGQAQYLPTNVHNKTQAHYKNNPIQGALLDVSSDEEGNNGEVIVDPGWDDFSLHSIKQFRPDMDGARRGRL